MVEKSDAQKTIKFEAKQGPEPHNATKSDPWGGGGLVGIPAGPSVLQEIFRTLKKVPNKLLNNGLPKFEDWLVS